MRKIYYNYIYLNPFKPGKYCYDGLNMSFLFEPFYVGKGKNNRYKTHTHNSKDKRGGKKSGLISAIKRMNIDPLEYVSVFNHNTENMTLDIEKWFIMKIGRRDTGLGPLLNMTDGGEGTSGYICSDKQKKDRSKRMVGNTISKGPDVNRRNWNNEQRKERSDNMKGKKLSKNTKEKISRSSKGMKRSEETITRIKEANTGKKRTEIQKKKISETRIKNSSAKGSKNPKAKIIYIYDNQGNIQFKCHGNVKNIIKSNGLPQSLLDSYRNDGRRIYMKRPTSEFHGWHAKQIKEKNEVIK